MVTSFIPLTISKVKINIYNKETGEYIESIATDIVASDIAAFGENEFY